MRMYRKEANLQGVKRQGAVGFQHHAARDAVKWFNRNGHFAKSETNESEGTNECKIAVSRLLEAICTAGPWVGVVAST